MINEIRNYVKRIDKAKFFLFHLVKWDIKFRFRGSKIGVFWTILQPLLLTLIIGTIFGFVFKQNMKDYAPYILSGLLVWDVINGGVVGNSYSFLQAEVYIKQHSHPIIIYPLRAALVSILTFLIASSSLIIWVLIVYPQNFLVGLVSFPLTVLIYFMLSWPVSIISSHIHIRFRDYPYIMNLVMQIMWYFSPVFFKREMFLNNAILRVVFMMNPVTQILNLIRCPIFDGSFASLGTYIYVFVLMIFLATVAWFVNRKCEKQVIFYF